MLANNLVFVSVVWVSFLEFRKGLLNNLCVVTADWFSEKTKPKVGYHFRKILKLKVDHFQKK